MMKMGELGIQVFIIKNSESSMGEGLEDANLLVGVMVGGRIEVQVDVGILMINLSTKSTISLSDKEDI